MSSSRIGVVISAMVVGLLIGSANAAVSMTTVRVGNPGNLPDSRYYSACGAVSYKYEIGKYEVTIGQYLDFLNKVAATDTYGLYNTAMANSSSGCNILRTGQSGHYYYYLGGTQPQWDAWMQKPISYVGWADAARFCNWMANGQPSGAQDASTTEDGSYALNGVIHQADLKGLARNAGATWVIPTENEWYKAAYHQNDGRTADYFDYPTSSNDLPAAVNPPGGLNSANYGHVLSHTTAVGAYPDSASPYGTFDQGGNVWEWNEAIFQGSEHGLRGGSAYNMAYDLHAAYWASFGWSPDSEGFNIGFRVVLLPEPATLATLALTGAAILRRRSPRKRITDGL